VDRLGLVPASQRLSDVLDDPCLVPAGTSPLVRVGTRGPDVGADPGDGVETHARVTDRSPGADPVVVDDRCRDRVGLRRDSTLHDRPVATWAGDDVVESGEESSLAPPAVDADHADDHGRRRREVQPRSPRPLLAGHRTDEQRREKQAPDQARVRQVPVEPVAEGRPAKRHVDLP